MQFWGSHVQADQCVWSKQQIRAEGSQCDSSNLKADCGIADADDIYIHRAARAFFAEGTAVSDAAAAGGAAPPFRLPFRCAGGLGPFGGGASPASPATRGAGGSAFGCGCAESAGSASGAPASPAAVATGMEAACRHGLSSYIQALSQTRDCARIHAWLHAVNRPPAPPTGAAKPRQHDRGQTADHVNPVS